MNTTHRFDIETNGIIRGRVLDVISPLVLTEADNADQKKNHKKNILFHLLMNLMVWLLTLIRYNVLEESIDKSMTHSLQLGLL